MERYPVTVIIPCFNDGATLSSSVTSAIESGAEQVLIVNDGSTDGHTLTVLRGLVDARVDVINVANGGPARARAHGLERVQTPYVFNLDADDELLIGGLATLYDAVNTDPALDVVWGDYVAVGERNQRQRTAESIDKWQLSLINDLPVSALFRTDLLRSVGGWDCEGYEDWDLWLKLAGLGVRGRRVAVPVFRYHIHAATADRARIRDEARHEYLLARLRDRHAELFRKRLRSWLDSRAPWSVRLLLPLATLVPVSGRRRVRLLWRVNQFSRGRYPALRRS